MPNSGQKFVELVNTMARLRSSDGCPWDKEQTYRDIAAHTLEETHEVLDAIDKSDFKSLCEELGDLLLQIVFYAQIAKEENRFTIDDIIDQIQKKLIHRHPHVFGEAKVSGSKDVLERWEELKKEEGKKSVLDGVPDALPALLKAFRIGEKTSRIGFDWPNTEGILEKVQEEAHELHEARTTGAKDKIDYEYGDLLFTLANLGRFLNVDPEGSLRRATSRFIKRFTWIERYAENAGLKLKNLNAPEWNELWQKAKANSEV